MDDLFRAADAVQPVDDTKALILQERAGYVPPQEIAGRFGYEFSDNVAQFKAANAARDDAGLIFDSDPRKTTASGAAQASADPAAEQTPI